MSDKACKTRVRIVPTPLNLPIFLSGRTRFRHDYWRKVPTHIEKKGQVLARHCSEVEDVKSKMERDLKNLIGIYPPNAEPCTHLHITKITRDLIEDKPWCLPPSTYDTTKAPFAKKRGYFGAYWRKISQRERDLLKQKPKANIQSHKVKGQWIFYEIPRGIDRLTQPAHKYKGKFLTNARDRRATARCMISYVGSAYRDPSEPSPTHYECKLHEIEYNALPKMFKNAPNPHLFLRHTSVPEKLMSHIPRHMSFKPTVGRYEVRFSKHCPCGRKILTPGLHLLIEREKRYKFRRLPYIKIKTHNKCYPDWDHVIGHGHRYLFRTTDMPTKTPKTPAKEKAADKANKHIQLYPDSKYINMINSPHKEYLSIRPGGLRQVPVRVRFNCISIKRVVRRQLRVNKKIVFNSGTERFPELDIRPMVFTATQLEELKSKLPPERQLRDQPVMGKRLSEIKSKLYETSSHLKSVYRSTLHKQDFKFQPLPEPKILVSEKELRPSLTLSTDLLFFYDKPINVYDFMKDSRQGSVVGKISPDTARNSDANNVLVLTVPDVSAEG
ncbi:uncharacterized protein LOC129245295 [Anastrepha obliqua]|uniref:uncharacterized protein LOC129245295 n=1 Tax=Anastrepha obliqua TaxID=95512 RepID=UPI00240A6534|nr:uncharacterized protein LOC129245295 [Anastrepha obliqua]